jgi:hypothetical protein
MTGRMRTPAGVETRQGGRVWHGAGGLLPVLAALVLWAVVLGGVAAPLGAFLARVCAGGGEMALRCPERPLALAAAARATSEGPGR